MSLLSTTALRSGQVKILLIGALLAVILGGVALFGAQRAALSGIPETTGPDAGFSRDMQAHHTQAVEMAMITWDQSEDPDVKSMAYDMATAQQAQIGHMYTWLQTWELTQSSDQQPMAWMEPEEDTASEHDGAHTPGMDGMDGTEGMEGMTGGRMPGLASEEDLTRLRTLAGVEGDRLFLTLMIEHHRGGVMMAEAAVDQAVTDEVQGFARKQVIAQQADIEAMEAMLSARS